MCRFVAKVGSLVFQLCGLSWIALIQVPLRRQLLCPLLVLPPFVQIHRDEQDSNRDYCQWNSCCEEKPKVISKAQSVGLVGQNHEVHPKKGLSMSDGSS